MPSGSGYRSNGVSTNMSTKLSQRPQTAQTNHSVVSGRVYQASSDSGYSSRHSTSHSSLVSSKLSVDVSERHIDSTSNAKFPSRPQSSPAHLATNQIAVDGDTKTFLRPKRVRSYYEPKQLKQWKTYMKSVTARVDSRWTTKDKASYQTGDMMKYKLTTRPTTPETESKESERIRVRSASRESRSKPWSDGSSRKAHSRGSSSAKSSRPDSRVEIHYEKTLPSSQWAECKPKKYVTNHRYGNHFETRVCKSNKYKYAPTAGMKFLWENNCQVWLMEKLNTTNFSYRRQSINADTSSTSSNQRESAQRIATTAQAQATTHKRPKTAPITARELAMEQNNWKNRLSQAEDKDKANVFDKFVEWSMANQKKKYAAVSIQRYARGWLVRMKIKKLKEKCMMVHGCNWRSFSNEYKCLLARIQRRCGEPKPSCPVTYQDIQRYMEKKEKYEIIFDEMKDENLMLPRDQIMPLFRKCGLFPLDREVKSAFRAVFKGCSVQSDVIFLLDCSASVGSTVYEMQLGLIKDIVGHCDVAYDKVRVAVIPYNDNVFRVIDFDSYGDKEELLSEIGSLSYETVRAYGQITRTDIALRCMTELVKRASEVNDHIRDGTQVPKICFAFTDGKCYHTQLTAKWAEMARKSLQVTMYAVTCSDELKTKRYLIDIASSEERILKLSEYKTMGLIKTAIQGQQCLKSCPLCHYAQKSVGEGASLCSDERRGLFKHEVLELIWMVYCPPATGLKKYRDSLWMSPQIEGKESMKLARYHPVGSDYRTCLRQAVKEKIAESGKVILPTETGVRVREITDVDLAMDFIDQLCVTKLCTLGLVEKVGLNVKAPAKYL